MSLSSSDSKSVVGLSESALYAHHYTSISQCIGGLSADKASLKLVSTQFQRLKMKYYPVSDTYSLQTDVSPFTTPFSKKLAERQYVHIPNNVVPGNKSVSVGCNYSYVNLSHTPEHGGSRWSLPLSVDRVGLNSEGISTAKMQLSALMTDKELPFWKARIVKNTSDSGYFSARYFAPLVEEHPNMVQICRDRHGSKVWQQATATERVKGQKGANSIYGKQTYYLIAQSDVKKHTNGNTKVVTEKNRTSIYDLAVTERHQIEETTSGGRKIIVKIERWNNMMIRTKKGYSMKDKPFDLFACQVIDAESGELVFQKPMFIAVFGQLKDQIDTQEVYQEYRNRFDIEGHNRFSSQKLLLDSYQTPIIEHLDNWAVIVAVAYWLLFVAADEVDLILKPWERYLPKNKAIVAAQKTATNQPKKSVAQTKKGTLALFCTFDRKAFAPKSVKNGKGRKTGTKILKKEDQKVNRKANNSNFDNKTQRNE
jgi:hypothetical protein